jgi:hypothetical protein
MNALEIEPHTVGAENFTSSFFYKQPVDGTKFSVRWQSQLPSTGFKEETETVVFDFQALDFPYSWEIGNLLISVKFNILNKDTQALPATEDTVTGINNMLHSLFKSVNLKINGEEITPSPEFYYYKAYLENLLTYSSTVKAGWLQSVGYSDDAPGKNLWHSADAEAYQNRTVFFRENLLETSPFSKEGAHLIGKLYHDLHTTDKGLPPHTRFQIELVRTSNDLFIEKFGALMPETKKFMVSIKSIQCFCPISNLSAKVANGKKYFFLYYKQFFFVL